MNKKKKKAAQVDTNLVVSIDELRTKPPETEGHVPQVVINHVLACLVKPTHVASICVDGGYTQAEAQGELARAGGDLGLSAALLALGFSPKSAFDLVLKFRLNNAQKYGWHTDTHEGHGDVVIGCGHANTAINHSEFYGVTSQDMLLLVQMVRNYQTKYPSHTLHHILNRQHSEQGVLIIADDRFTVQPWGKKNDQDQRDNLDQFFIYDQTRDQKLLAQLWQFVLASKNIRQGELEINGEVLTLPDFEKIVEKQTNATLGLLPSSQGKPVYIVSLNETSTRLKITQAGCAPTPDSLGKNN